MGRISFFIIMQTDMQIKGDNLIQKKMDNNSWMRRTSFITLQTIRHHPSLVSHLLYKLDSFKFSFCVFVLSQLQGARILGIPVVVSEQYPKGLGSTVQEMDLTGAKLVFPKTKFSMVLPEVEAALVEIPGVRSVVLFGVEVSSMDCNP